MQLQRWMCTKRPVLVTIFTSQLHDWPDPMMQTSASMADWLPVLFACPDNHRQPVLMLIPSTLRVCDTGAGF